jgi:predicted aspartyl protease
MRKILLLAAFCLTALPARADESCRLVQMSVLDMSIDSAGGVYVPMTISGQSVNMLIDTGGIFTMLTEQTVQRLGLKKLLPSTGMFDGGAMLFGGKKLDKYTEAHDVDLGGLKAADIPMWVMPDGLMAPELGGTIAPNILSHYDADFDFANARFRLFSQDHCDGKVVYWTTNAPAVIPIIIDREGHIEIPVKLDGREIEAVIDTGSSSSILSLETARRSFDIDDKDPKLTSLAGGRLGQAFRYPFGKLTFENVTVDNPDMVLISDAVSQRPEGALRLILGMGILRQLHLYIAYREHKLYVTSASAH